jgi:hypothetical protein
MWARLSDLLARDPKVTARALELYDPKLPREIAKEWKIAVKDTTAVERGDHEDEHTSEAALIVTEAGLKMALERRRAQVAVLEAELERREPKSTQEDDGCKKDRRSA